MSAIAVLDGITHRYAKTVAVADVTISVPRGVTALVGVNGAGKSTLLRIMATALEPTAGTMRLCSVGDPWRDRALGRTRQRIALMPQTFVPPGGVRTRDFLHYMAWMRGVPRAARSARVDASLDVVQLADRASDRLTTLSGGMLRRALLAQALLAEPELLLLDEPTAGLDPEQRIRMRDLVADQGRNRAVVVSSHLIEDLVPIADRVVMLDDGAVVFDGQPDELLAIGNPAAAAAPVLSSYEAAFLLLRRRERQA